MNTATALIFLDFDGVLHPAVAGSHRFIHVKALEAVIREPIEQGHLRIVISSDWRKTSTLSELRVRFSSDVASAIIGTTPVFNDPGLDSLRTAESQSVAGYEPRNQHLGIRQREIMQWRAHNAPDSTWVALDDNPELFTPLCENLIHVNGALGLQAVQLDELADRIAALTKPRPGMRI